MIALLPLSIKSSYQMLVWHYSDDHYLLCSAMLARSCNSQQNIECWALANTHVLYNMHLNLPCWVARLYAYVMWGHFILEWLVDRRHCQSKWQDAALVIREKINDAIQDMPAVDEIMQLLSGSCMYFVFTWVLFFFMCYLFFLPFHLME